MTPHTCASCRLQPKCKDHDAIAETVTATLAELAVRLPQQVDWDCLEESITEWLCEAVAEQCEHWSGTSAEKCQYCVYERKGRECVECVATGYAHFLGACGHCEYLRAPVSEPPCSTCCVALGKPGWVPNVSGG